MNQPKKPISGGATPGSFVFDPNFKADFISINAPKLDSKLDTGRAYVHGQDINESRAQRQDTSDKAFNGIVKGMGLAGTTFAGTFTSLPLGLAIGTGKLVNGEGFSEALSSVYDNPVSNYFDQFNKNMEEWLPNYYTQEERDAHAFSSDNWFTANFLFDKFIKNAGFTVGAIGSGAVVSKGLYGLAKLSMAGNYAKEAIAVQNLMTKGYNVEQALAKVGGGLRLANAGVKFGATMAAAAGEGSIEALQSKKETLEHLVKQHEDKYGVKPTAEQIAEMDELATSAGNAVFGANLAILGTSDMIQFGRFLGTGYKNELKRMAAKPGEIIKKGTDFTGAPIGKIGKAANVLGGPVTGMITEAWEEGSQHTAQESAKRYAARKYNDKSMADMDNLLMSVGEGLGNTFGTKQGMESMLLGALTGIGSRVATGEIASDLGANSEREARIQSTITKLNEFKAKSVFQKAYDSAVTAKSISEDMEQAVKSGDMYSYKNLENDYFKNYINSRIETGRFDVLVDELKDLKNLNPNEFAETFGLPKLRDNEQLVSLYIDKLVAKAEKINKTADDVDIRFQGANPMLKKILTDNIVDIDDRNARINKLSMDIANISNEGGKLGIVPSAIMELYPNEYHQHLEDQFNRLTETNPLAADQVKDMVKDYVSLIEERKGLLTLYKQLAGINGEEVAAQIEEEAKQPVAPVEEPKAELPVEDDAPKQQEPIVQPEVKPQAAKTVDDIVKNNTETTVETTVDKDGNQVIVGEGLLEKSASGGFKAPTTDDFTDEFGEDFGSNVTNAATEAIKMKQEEEVKEEPKAEVKPEPKKEEVKKETPKSDVVEEIKLPFVHKDFTIEEVARVGNAATFKYKSSKGVGMYLKMMVNPDRSVTWSVMTQALLDKKEGAMPIEDVIEMIVDSYGSITEYAEHVIPQQMRDDMMNKITAKLTPEAAPKTPEPPKTPVKAEGLPHVPGKVEIKGINKFTTIVKPNAKSNPKGWQAYEDMARLLKEDPSNIKNFVVEVHNTYASKVTSKDRIYQQRDNALLAKADDIDVTVKVKTASGEVVIGYLDSPYRTLDKVKRTPYDVANMTPQAILDTFAVSEPSIDKAKQIADNHAKAKQLWSYLSDEFKKAGAPKQFTFEELSGLINPVVTSSFANADYMDRPALTEVAGFNHDGEYFIYDTFKSQFDTKIPLFEENYQEDLDKVTENVDSRYFAMFNKDGKNYWEAVKPAALAPAIKGELLADINKAINGLKEISGDNLVSDEKYAELIKPLNAKYFISGPEGTSMKFEVESSQHSNQTFKTHKLNINIKVQPDPKNKDTRKFEKVYLTRNVSSMADVIGAINKQAPDVTVFTEAFKSNVTMYPDMPSAEFAKLFESTLQNVGDYHIRLDVDPARLDKKAVETTSGDAPIDVTTPETSAPVEAPKPVPGVVDYMTMSDAELAAIPEAEWKTVVKPALSKAKGGILRLGKVMSLRNKNSGGGAAGSIATKIGASVTNGLIDVNKAKEWVRTKLPNWVAVEDIDRILDSVNVNGILWGAYLDKVMYLSRNAEAGTEYHEAFHAVFRSMLTDGQRERYYTAALMRFGGVSDANIQELLDKDNSLVDMSREDMVKLVLEERMADDFMAFMKTDGTKPSFMRTLFNRIKSILRWLGLYGNQLDSLYADINKGAFKQTTYKGNKFGRAKFAYKLIPGINDVNTSNQIVGDIVAKLATEEGLSYFNVRERVERELDIKYRMYTEAAEHVEGMESSDYIDTMAMYANVFSLEGAAFDGDKEVTPRDVIKEEVVVKLLPILEQDEISDEERDDELNEVREGGWDKDIYENGGFESVSKEIRNFIAFTSYQAPDALGNTEYTLEDGTFTVERQINYAKTFSAMQMMLASKNLEDMIPQLEAAAAYNPQLQAVVDKLRRRTGYTYDASTGAYEFSVPNGELFMNKFVKTFEKEKINYIHIGLDKKNTKSRTSIHAANNADPKMQIFDEWRANYEAIITNSGAVDKKAIQAARTINDLYRAKQLIASEGQTLFKYKSVDEAVEAYHNAMTAIGVEVPHALIKYSIENYDPKLDLDGVDANKGVIDPRVFTYMTKTLEGGGNPYLRVLRGDVESEAGRIIGLADLAVPFHGGMITPSFKGADGKMRYSYIRPNEFIVRNREIMNLHKPELRAAYIEKNPYVASNYLLTNERAEEILSNVEIAFTGDIREKNRPNGKGVTFRDIDPKAFQVMQHSLFYTPLKTTNQELTYARYYTMVMESSSTAFATKLPVNYGAYRNGQISPEAMTVLYDNLFMTEFNRIKSQQKVIEELKATNPKAMIENYHTKGRATKFTDFTFLERPMTIGNESYHIGDMVREMTPNQLAEKSELIKTAIRQGIQAEIELEKAEAVANGMFYTPKGDGSSTFSTRVEFLDEAAMAAVMGIADGKLTDSSLHDYFGTFVVNNIIANTSINHLVLGDAAIFKDDTDVVKRAKGMIASGESLYSPFTSKPLRSQIGDYKLKNYEFLAAVIKDPVVFVNKNDNRANWFDDMPDADKELYKKSKGKGEEADEARSKFEAKYSEQEIADAQSWVLVKKKINDSKAGGRISPEAMEAMQKIDSGDTSYKWTSEAKDGFVMNSDKNVYYDHNQVYKKDSEVVLDPLMTSIKLEDGTYVARPGREFLHNLREWMEKNGIEKTNTKSGSKGRTSHMLDVGAEGNFPQPSDEELMSMINDRRAQRLQVETPSGKTKIVFGTQLMQLVDSELQDSEPVSVAGIAGVHNLGELRRSFRDLLAKTRGVDYTKVRKALGKFEVTGTLTRDDEKFFEQMQHSLRASGANETMIEMFKPGSNPNLPHTLAKFEQLFMAHFKAGFSQKVPGLKMALLSPLGFEVVADENDNVITQSQLERDYFGEKKYWDGNVLKTGDEVKFKRRLLKAQRLSSNGEKILFGEVLMPIWSKELLGIEKGMSSDKMSPEVRDKILTMMGIRIPTQSQHSMFHFKVVDFLPAHYGSTIVVPAEIAYLAGSDFDIDSMFIYRKDYWVDNDGKFHVHEEGKGTKEAFADYRAYNLKDSGVKGDIKDFLYNDEIYKDAVVREKAARKTVNFIKDKLKSDKAKLDAFEKELASIGTEEYEASLDEDEAQIITNFSTPEETEEYYRIAVREKMLEMELALGEAKKEVSGTEAQLATLTKVVRAYTKAKNEYKTLVENKALRKNGYATTEEEYANLTNEGKTTNSIRNNQILDAMLGMVSHGSTWESQKTPASLTKLKKSAEFLFEKVRGLKEGSSMRTSPVGTRGAWHNNAVGKKNVGPWANVNASSALLTRHNVDTETIKVGDNVIYTKPVFDGIEFGTFRYQQEADIIFMNSPEGVVVKEYNSKDFIAYEESETIMGQEFFRVGAIDKNDKNEYYKRANSNTLYAIARKADSLSTGVSAMTDNAKERLAALLNITLKTSNTLAVMESLGMGTARTSLLASQESIRDISTKASASDSAVNVAKSEFDIEQSVIDTWETKLKNFATANPNATAEEIEQMTAFGDLDPSQLTSQLLLEALYLEKKKKHANHDLGMADMYTAFDEFKYIQIQIAAARFYKNVNYVAGDVSKLAKIMKLNKGLPTTIAEAEDIYDAAVDLGLIKGEFTSHIPSFSLDHVVDFEKGGVNYDANLRENVNKLVEILNNLSKAYFIGQTNFAIGTRNELESTELKEAGVKKAFYDSIDRDLLSFLTLRVYNKVYNERMVAEGTPEKVRSLKDVDALIHPAETGRTLAERLIDLKRTNPRFAKNEFVKFLDTELSNVTIAKRKAAGVDEREPFSDNEATIDSIVGDTRRRLTPEYENELIDSFRELRLSGEGAKFGPEVNAFAENLFYYLIAKDNLQFKNKSFINFIAPEVYTDVTTGLNQLIEELGKPLIEKRNVDDSTNESETEDDDSGFNSAYLDESRIENLVGMNTARLRDEFIRRFMRQNGNFKNAQTGSDKKLKNPEGTAMKVSYHIEGEDILGIEFDPKGMKSGDLRFFKGYRSKKKADGTGGNIVAINYPRFLNWDTVDTKGDAITLNLELRLEGQVKGKYDLLRRNGKLVGTKVYYSVTSSIGGEDWKVMHYDTMYEAEQATIVNEERTAKAEPETMWKGGFTKLSSLTNPTVDPSSVSAEVPGETDTETYTGFADNDKRTGVADLFDDDSLPGAERRDGGPLSKEDLGDQELGFDDLQRQAAGEMLTESELADIVSGLEAKFGITATIVNDDSLPYAGAYKKGKVIINAAKARRDTPFHEYAHPFVEVIEKNNVPLYNNLVKQIQDSEILARVSSLYTDNLGYTDSDRVKEAIVQAIGEYASGTLVEPGLVAAIKRLLARIAQFITQKLGMNTPISAGSLASDLTLGELGELLSQGNTTKINLDFVAEIDSYQAAELEKEIEDIETQLVEQGLLRITCKK